MKKFYVRVTSGFEATRLLWIKEILQIRLSKVACDPDHY